MGPLSVAERLLWYVSVFLFAGLALELCRRHLHRVYPWFTAFAGFNFLQALTPFVLSTNTRAHAWAYLLTQPVIWFLYIVTSLELYSLVLRNHPGIATVGRRTLVGALTIAILVSALTLQADLRGPQANAKILVYYGVIERGISFSLVVFLLIILFFAIRYPIPLKRNIATHAIVFSIFFLSSSMALFLMNVTGFEIRRLVSTALLAIADACLVAWLLLLTPAGEEQSVVLRQRLAPEDEERLLEQLEAINASLSRIARK